jgi:hypothetical protein
MKPCPYISVVGEDAGNSIDNKVAIEGRWRGRQQQRRGKKKITTSKE